MSLGRCSLEPHLPSNTPKVRADLPCILTYRYEREVNRGQRSWLKKLLEQDVPSSHAMVLRVARIIQPDPDQQSLAMGSQKPQLQLTDGWYGIKAVVDPPLASLIRRKQICEGEVSEPILALGKLTLTNCLNHILGIGTGPALRAFVTLNAACTWKRDLEGSCQRIEYQCF